jgi:hypothetical protein
MSVGDADGARSGYPMYLPAWNSVTQGVKMEVGL